MKATNNSEQQQKNILKRLLTAGAAAACREKKILHTDAREITNEYIYINVYILSKYVFLETLNFL